MSFLCAQSSQRRGNWTVQLGLGQERSGRNGIPEKGKLTETWVQVLIREDCLAKMIPKMRLDRGVGVSQEWGTSTRSIWDREKTYVEVEKIVHHSPIYHGRSEKTALVTGGAGPGT